MPDLAAWLSSWFDERARVGLVYLVDSVLELCVVEWKRRNPFEVVATCASQQLPAPGSDRAFMLPSCRLPV
jgi:hypothetical protein